MKLYEEIFKRAKKLDRTISMRKIFLEACVDPSNIQTWRKKESELLSRWGLMLKSVGVDPFDVDVDERTYAIIKKRCMTHKGTANFFVKHGFDKLVSKTWEAGDPNYVQNFKKVSKVLQQYENSVLS